MKKCPQCGTILEESKKKCYMCGAELQKKSFMDFGDTFDEQIGATVTNGQDNVFNNVGNVMNGANGQVAGNDSNVTFASAMSSADEIKEEIAEILPSKYDHRTAIEKIFSTDARYKNTEDFNINNDQTFSAFSNTEVPPLPATPSVPTPPPVVQEPVEKKKKKEKKKKTKPDINWGDNLNSGSGDVKDTNDDGSGFKISFATIFNIISVIIFIVTLVFLYFKFLAPETEVKKTLGGLTYEIDEDFHLSSEEGHSRYYLYGSSCAVKVSYGATVETDGFIDNYFEKVKNSFPNSTTKISEIQKNGNVWTEISVLDFNENAAASNGFAEVLRYKYVTVVHKGNFYDIVFANDNEDAKCISMFERFMDSVRLE